MPDERFEYARRWRYCVQRLWKEAQRRHPRVKRWLVHFNKRWLPHLFIIRLAPLLSPRSPGSANPSSQAQSGEQPDCLPFIILCLHVPWSWRTRQIILVFADFCSPAGFWGRRAHSFPALPISANFRGTLTPDVIKVWTELKKTLKAKLEKNVNSCVWPELSGTSSLWHQGGESFLRRAWRFLPLTIISPGPICQGVHACSCSCLSVKVKAGVPRWSSPPLANCHFANYNDTSFECVTRQQESTPVWLQCGLSPASFLHTMGTTWKMSNHAN